MKIEMGPDRMIATMTDDEARTMYFSLRAYRDQLHKSLQKLMYSSLDGDDYREYDYNVHIDTGKPLTDFVPDVHMTAMLDNNTDYEELAFLFETLSKINMVLFDMLQNHNEARVQHINRFMNI